ncbi:hypothetical protein PLCT2_01638 [Planctomycetaceae bacterium]|nr:hypothetical protein PLCT2_01638 [Planctomycetaceae bacterium]
MGESLRHVKPERIRLKDHPEFNEAWLQAEIAKDPGILGLGDSLYVAARELRQPQGGRLDLLLIDRNDQTRYEVELMLGDTDPSHIIRCIEYWDVERKRNASVEHVAVLVAETVTSRFLNVIGLFNSVIPIIAIQLNALKVGDAIVLNFVRVLDLVRRAEDEEESNAATVGRSDWETWSSKEAITLLDSCFDLLRGINPTARANYKGGYVGVMFGNIVDNVAVFRPRGNELRVDTYRLRDVAAWQRKLATAGFAVQEKYEDRVVFTITRALLERNTSLLKELFAEAVANKWSK